MIYFEDISSSKKLRHAQLQDEMQRLYSANFSHEMRTPLSTVIEFTDLMVQRIKSGSVHGPGAHLIEHDLQIVKFSSMLMLKQVNDILDTEQITHGTFITKPEKTTARSIVNEVVQALALKANSLKIQLSEEYEQDADKSLLADKQRAQQITMNLISNAIKFSRNGAIEVRAWQSQTRH